LRFACESSRHQHLQQRAAQQTGRERRPLQAPTCDDATIGIGECQAEDMLGEIDRNRRGSGLRKREPISSIQAARVVVSVARLRNASTRPPPRHGSD
jgi:hypothetical protein